MKDEAEVREYLSLLNGAKGEAQEKCLPERKEKRLTELESMVRAVRWILGEINT